MEYGFVEGEDKKLRDYLEESGFRLDEKGSSFFDPILLTNERTGGVEGKILPQPCEQRLIKKHSLGRAPIIESGERRFDLRIMVDTELDSAVSKYFQELNGNGLYFSESVKTVHLGVYADENRHGVVGAVSDPKIYVQANKFILARLGIGEDPTGKSRDTNFEYLGQRAAGNFILCGRELEQVVVHPGVCEGMLEIDELEDLRNVAKGIAEFLDFRKGVRVGEEYLELPKVD